VGQRRMLPRLPPTYTLAGHSMVVTCCAVHPVFTIAVSGSEDGTVKVGFLRELVRSESLKWRAGYSENLVAVSPPFTST
jgi:WD40 repeat protein